MTVIYQYWSPLAEFNFIYPGLVVYNASIPLVLRFVQVKEMPAKANRMFRN